MMFPYTEPYWTVTTSISKQLENRGLIVMGNEGKGISPALAKKVNHKIAYPELPGRKSHCR